MTETHYLCAVEGEPDKIDKLEERFSHVDLYDGMKRFVSVNVREVRLLDFHVDGEDHDLFAEMLNEDVCKEEHIKGLHILTSVLPGFESFEFEELETEIEDGLGVRLQELVKLERD